MKNYILIDPTKINKEDQTLSEARNPKDWEQRTKTQDEERRAKKAKANQNTSPPPTTTTPATDPPPEKPKKEKEEKKKKENEKEEKKTKPEYVIAAAAEKYLDLEISGKTGFNILGQAAQKVGFGVDVGDLFDAILDGDLEKISKELEPDINIFWSELNKEIYSWGETVWDDPGEEGDSVRLSPETKAAIEGATGTITTVLLYAYAARNAREKVLETLYEANNAYQWDPGKMDRVLKLIKTGGFFQKVGGENVPVFGGALGRTWVQSKEKFEKKYKPLVSPAGEVGEEVGDKLKRLAKYVATFGENIDFGRIIRRTPIRASFGQLLGAPMLGLESLLVKRYTLRLEKAIYVVENKFKDNVATELGFPKFAKANTLEELGAEMNKALETAREVEKLYLEAFPGGTKVADLTPEREAKIEAFWKDNIGKMDDTKHLTSIEDVRGTIAKLEKSIKIANSRFNRIAEKAAGEAISDVSALISANIKPLRGIAKLIVFQSLSPQKIMRNYLDKEAANPDLKNFMQRFVEHPSVWKTIGGKIDSDTGRLKVPHNQGLGSRKLINQYNQKNKQIDRQQTQRDRNFLQKIGDWISQFKPGRRRFEESVIVENNELDKKTRLKIAKALTNLRDFALDVNRELEQETAEINHQIKLGIKELLKTMHTFSVEMDKEIDELIEINMTFDPRTQIQTPIEEGKIRVSKEELINLISEQIKNGTRTHRVNKHHLIELIAEETNKQVSRKK
jgi:hypothetical protein